MNPIDGYRSKRNLCCEFDISLSTTRRTLELINANLKARTYPPQVVAQFRLARKLLENGNNAEAVAEFFRHRNQLKPIPNQSQE